MYTTRVLPPEEWHRLQGLGHFASCALPDPEHSAIVVVEDGGRIIGTQIILNLVHLEGVWIDPEYRHKPGVVRGLVEETWGALHAFGISTVFTIGQATDVIVQAFRLGFERIDGVLLMKRFDNGKE